MPELDDVTKQLMDDIEERTRKCWNCNFCISACPVFKNTYGFYSRGASGLTQSLYYAIRWDLLDGPDKEELMYNVFRCTTCNACVNRCSDLSAGIPLMEIIERGRKLLVEKSIGPMPDQRKVLESIYMYGNPYNQAQEKRLEWLKDLKVKMLPGEKAEVVFFVGCSTSYEPALQNLARSLVKLFQLFEVDFGILEEEKCSAETVIRLGDEVLFEELSVKNVELFKKTGAKTIVTISPHDFNTFTEDYESLKDNFEIKHYTEFFADKLDEKKIEFKNEIDANVTYHDPCYLSKHHGIMEAPRKLLKAIPKLNLVEMKLSGRDNLCCGGGGGRMFTEVEEEERLSDMRVGQALEVDAKIIATACPWCHIMLDNAVRDLKVDDKIKVMDVSEILVQALY
jgi:Fe-S oxidoreductase